MNRTPDGARDRAQLREKLQKAEQVHETHEVLKSRPVNTAGHSATLPGGLFNALNDQAR